MASWVSVLCVLVSVTSLQASLTSNSILRSTADLHNPRPIVNDSFLFIKAIRRNLRRNNDDYVVEQLPIETTVSLATENDTVTPFIGSQSKSANVPRLKSKIRKPKLKLELPELKLALPNKNDTRSGKNILKLINLKQRPFQGNKWQRLVKKSKKLAENVSSSNAMSKKLRQFTTSLKMRAKEMRPVGRAFSLHELLPLRTRGPNREPPNAEQLDMAVARGAYINDMRAKGRICHRHILWPEGPKYDNQGNIILPMYRSKLYKGRDFSQTKKPVVILPRCCNCCKKSVLGCQ